MSLPYMPFFTRDYLGDTIGLKIDEHGAYCVILFHLWQNEGALPMDSAYLARICGVTAGRFERKLWPAICGYFEVRTDRVGSTLEHRRLSRELEKARAKYSKLSNAGKRGFLEKQRKNNGGSQARLKPGMKQPEPEPIKTTTPLADRVSRAGLKVVSGSDDRRALEAFATREAASATDSGGDNEDR